MNLHSTITAVVCIIIMCIAILIGLGQLLWIVFKEWDGVKALACILLSFITAYITISYMIVVVRDFIELPALLWE